MPVLVKIAIRNLREHKSKTLIIGIIIALGIMIMLLGNSLMETAARGIRRSFIDNYTGHVMISAKAEGNLSLFGAQGPQTGNDEIPRIPRYEGVYEHATSLPEVRNTVSQVSGFGLFSFEEKGNQFGILFGIEPENYRSMFSDSITVVGGRYLEPGEEGILLSESKIKEIEEDIGITVPQTLVDVHTAAVVLKQRLWHKGRRETVLARNALGDVLVDLNAVSHTQ